MIRCARPGPRTSIALVAVALLAVAVATDACVIADPPTDLPQQPPTPPLIVRGSVVPSPSSILAVWPEGTFEVPVQLLDPRVPIVYSTFVDYNPVTGTGIDGNSPVTVDYSPGTTVGNIRTLHIPITRPPPDRCHVIEIVVALRFKASNSAQNLHTPDDPGGDSVNWFFNPSGDLAGCPALDAGTGGGPGDGGLP